MLTIREALIDGDPLIYSIAFAMQKSALIDEESGYVLGVFDTALEARNAAKEAGLTKDQYHLEAYAENTPKTIDDIYDRLENAISSILYETESEFYSLYISGKSNFRTSIDPDYKANRKNTPRPLLYEEVRNLLVSDFDAIFAEDGFEADDEIANIALTEERQIEEDWVICSIDKDFHQVPGWHYRWPTHNKEGDLFYLDHKEAMINYWTQVLTGDVADNIPGIKGVGPKKAANQLIGCNSHMECKDACLDMYLKKMTGMEEADILARFEKNLKLLKLGKEIDYVQPSGTDC